MLRSRQHPTKFRYKRTPFRCLEFSDAVDGSLEGDLHAKVDLVPLPVAEPAHTLPRREPLGRVERPGRRGVVVPRRAQIKVGASN